MKKKLVGIIMGVAMTATTITAPTAIFADDIDIEDIAVETEADSGEIAQQEILNEEDEVDWTMEDNSDEIDSASDIDIYSDFTSENVATEEVGAEEVTPVFSGFTNASRVSSEPMPHLLCWLIVWQK